MIKEKEKYSIYIILCSALIMLLNATIKDTIYVSMFWGISQEVAFSIRSGILIFANIIFTISSIVFLVNSIKSYINCFK